MSWYNPYILIPLVTWAIAQLAKTLIAAIKNQDRFDIRYLYASGGMPSAHSAVVCSLAVTALLRSGITSPIFGLSAVFAAIVMYDSFGVRRAAGEQAAAINIILETLSKQRLGFSHPQARLREILGHKPLEVTVGALSGIVLGLVLNANFLTPQIDWLKTYAGRTESIVYIAIGLAIVIAGLILGLVLRRQHPSSKAIKSLAQQIMVMTTTVGILALILGFATNQKALYLGWRLWVYVLVAIAIIWIISLVAIFGKKLPDALTREAEQRRIRKWLPGKRKSSRKG